MRENILLSEVLMILKKRFGTFCLLFITLFSTAFFAMGKNIEIIKIRDIGLEKGGELYRWIDVTFDEEDNLYVTDMLDYSVKKYDSKGVFVKRTGKRGRGPGEFYSPGLIAYSKGKIYVTQQMFPGIQVFDKELHFKYSIRNEVPITDIRMSKRGELFVFSPSIKGEKIPYIAKIRTGSKYSKLIFNKSSSFLDDGAFSYDGKDNIIRIFNGKNKIIKYSQKGKIIWEKSIPFLRKEAGKLKNIKGFKVNLYDKFIFKGIDTDSEGLIYILGGHYCKSKEVYVLNQKGEYLKTLKLKESSHTIKINKNFLFSRGNDGESISVYKIVKK